MKANPLLNYLESRGYEFWTTGGGVYSVKLNSGFYFSFFEGLTGLVSRRPDTPNRQLSSIEDIIEDEKFYGLI